MCVCNQSTDGVVLHQATLCSMKGCMRAMVAQLKSDSEDLQQVNSPAKILEVSTALKYRHRFYIS